VNALLRVWRGARALASRWAARAAVRHGPGDATAGGRWLRAAAGLAPEFSQVHRDLVAARRRSGDRLGAMAVASSIAQRFQDSADAWVMLGDAAVAAFRPVDAILAYERALQLEERADAAMAAGQLYALKGDQVTAGARYARAYAAGAGPDALKANAKALRAAGDIAAAAEAEKLWEKETGRPPGDR
jgi:tetratricopeptide (TPR) repeat protein